MNELLYSIIDKKIDIFLKHVNHDINTRKHRLFSLPFFDIFSNESVKNVQLFSDIHKSVETEIMNTLFIETIKTLLKAEGIRFIEPDDIYKRYVYLDNPFDYDERNDFLFIIDNDLYRFTEAYEEETKLKKKYNVKNIYVISFDNRRIKNSKYIALEHFFKKYLSVEIYEYYIDKVKNAVKKAYEMTGLSTVNILDDEYASTLKIQLLKHIKESFDYSQLYSDDKDFIIPKNDLIMMNKRFFDEKFYQYIVGNSEFAKCFLTSEYLYGVIKSVSSFDYTSIVLGYFKAIEYLIITSVNKINTMPDRKVFKLCRFSKGSPECIERLNKDKNKCKNFDTCDQVESFDANSVSWYVIDKKIKVPTFEDNIIQLCYNPNIQLLSTEGRKAIYKILNDYRVNARNGYIHQDNLYSLKEVENIRRKSWLCVFYILSGFKGIDLKDFSGQINILYYRNIIKAFHEIPPSVDHFIIKKDSKVFNTVIYNPYKSDIKDEELLKFYITSDYSEIPYMLNEEEKKKYEILSISIDTIPDSIEWQTSSKKGTVFNKDSF